MSIRTWQTTSSGGGSHVAWGLRRAPPASACRSTSCRATTVSCGHGFSPVDSWPTGIWRERTGRTQIELGVDLADGHWRWQHRSTSIAGLRIPARLAPRVRGEKRIVDGMYRFDVELALPLLGTVMRYGGLMTMVGP